ncbi:SH3 domain-containing protein [Bradyrhizobium manausense]|uniref:SH3 domain-containing protein n=1 Tax=Bradyrhizobium manausense TaxID=989370 RepID=UPI001BA87301|nr:SH3 domain-containing protein [Bradyrhizobium manausense]MBR1086613.1 SH3 domain-containing protein [Bradyrhizobium manausense]
MRLRTALVAALLLAPTAALAAPGIVTVSTGLRAGPGAGFPLVDRIPEGARVNIHGCLRGNAWCDVSFSDDRGWVSSQYLEYLYRNHYVYLPDYADEVDVPVVPFALSSYWSSYYEGRPWYRRHAYWNSYWTSHERIATRMTIDPRAARIGRAATRDAALALRRDGHVKDNARDNTAVSDAATARRDSIGAKREAAVGIDRNRAAGSQRLVNERAAVHGRNPRDAQARMTHEQAASHAVRAQPTRPHEAPRLSAAPAARPAMPHIAQPDVSHGAPMNAHAQMPAPRAAAPAPAMPHPAGGGGGAPHISAAPHGGGAPGGAHEKH